MYLVEFMGFQLCKAVVLDCAHVSVISRSDAELPDEVPFEDILAVERFDRGPAGQRIHMEEFAQVLRYDPKHKYGKGLQKDYSDMLRIIDQLSARPAQDVQEFVNRFVTFILMDNTDAHLKNWAFRYSDGVHPELAPLYDPVCVTAFFEGVPKHDYALNRAIDKTVRDLDALLEKAKVMRRGRILQVAKTVAARAKAEWPELLKGAPESMQRAIAERLAGGVALASIPVAAGQVRRTQPPEAAKTLA
jgi:serine/threonine-protein kinase HipA